MVRNLSGSLYYLRNIASQEEPRWIENDESKQIGDIELTQTGEELVHTDYQNTDLFIRRTLSVKPQVRIHVLTKYSVLL